MNRNNRRFSQRDYHRRSRSPIQRRRPPPLSSRQIRRRSRSKSPIPLSERFRRIEREKGLPSVTNMSYQAILADAKEISIVIERNTINLKPNAGPIRMSFNSRTDIFTLPHENKNRKHALFDHHEILQFRHDFTHATILLLPEERKPPNVSTHDREPRVRVERRVIFLPEYERRLKQYILDRKKDPSLPEFSSRPDKGRALNPNRDPFDVPRKSSYYQHDDRQASVTVAPDNRVRQFGRNNFSRPRGGNSRFGADDVWKHDKFQELQENETTSRRDDGEWKHDRFQEVN